MIFPLYSHCRGFGFVTFTDPATVEKVIQRGTHEVDKKKVKHCHNFTNFTF